MRPFILSFLFIIVAGCSVIGERDNDDANADLSDDVPGPSIPGSI